MSSQSHLPHWSICFCPCSFVCLYVCMQDYSKTRAWIWMICCVSTDVGTWTNWLTFEPIRIVVRIPEPDCFLRYRISAAIGLRGILRWENPPVYLLAARHSARRGFKIVIFTEPSKHLCRRYIRSTECSSSFLLPLFIFSWKYYTFFLLQWRLNPFFPFCGKRCCV